MKDHRDDSVNEQLRQAMRLWTLAQPVVSGFVASVVRDFSARDDVLQEIAVAVIESFERYDPARPFVGWALGIAQNQVRLYLRRVQRDRLVLDETVISQLASAFESVPQEHVQQLGHLRDCLAKLDGRARQLCDLRYVQDLKPAGIAPAVGMSANAVAKTLQRIRDQLRECIERQTTLAGGPA